MMDKLNGMTKKIHAMLIEEGFTTTALAEIPDEELAALPGITLDRAQKITTAAKKAVDSVRVPMVDYKSDDGVAAAPPVQGIRRSVRVQRIYDASRK